MNESCDRYGESLRSAVNTCARSGMTRRRPTRLRACTHCGSEGLRAVEYCRGLWVHGSTGPRVYGSTGPRVYGSTGPRIYGSTGLRVYGA
eukprot:1609312-Pyramimonas_sp.AAC.1